MMDGRLTSTNFRRLARNWPTWNEHTTAKPWWILLPGGGQLPGPQICPDYVGTTGRAGPAALATRTSGLGADDLFWLKNFGDQLYLMEIDRSLEAARAQAGIDQFEFVGFDACLMAQLEVFNALVPHARYSVASQETEPALGWAYTSFLTELANNPGMDGAELGQHIVNSYIDQDQRIVDDTARQAFVAEAYGFEGQVTPQEVAEVSGTDITLTAVNLAGIPAVNAALDKLAASLVNIDPGVVAQARAYAQAFTTIFGDEMPSPYIDLANFAQLAVQLSGDARVSAAADELNAALSRRLW